MHSEYEAFGRIINLAFAIKTCKHTNLFFVGSSVLTPAKAAPSPGYQLPYRLGEAASPAAVTV